MHRQLMQNVEGEVLKESGDLLEVMSCLTYNRKESGVFLASLENLVSTLLQQLHNHPT